MGLPRQPVTTLTPQSIDRDRQLAELLLGQAQRQQPQGPGALIGGLAQALAGRQRFERASSGEEQLRQQERDTLATVLGGLPGGGGSVGGVSLADVLSSPNRGLQNVGGALLQSQLRGDEDLLSPAAFEQQSALRTAGAPSVTTNVGSPNVNLTTGSQTAVQKRELNAQGALQRLDDIAASFDPEFLTVPAQLTARWQSFKDRLGSVGSIFGIEGLTPEEKQSLTEYTTFTTRTLNNMNITLNELSGAAVNEQEFLRIKGALPNSDDSPTQFQAKLTNAIRDMRRSVARFHHAQVNGLDPLDSGIALDGIDTLIDQTGNQLVQQLRAQGVPEDQINALVVEELRRQFGL